ncbi:MAG: Asp-tRNA(Asn)/Glu-tRNA(Gln) amidotransferase subunit GatC [Streptococcaceae bacterium]|nr:Asp-tRNA(Asn)/Glu-tRNA(Gln) amidotransferase subunit GatC [Streptococcaceae bacterium]MCL2681045.1 Asp-tRNA(Asn)/Glu-tRNA(Gln) amidotransferase subunit GatC [Streptococcaceae bacterium]MCL2858279.1 Asp-tRNA(Asn)/Glu-tRNA(Gln) amidotransferase subunit GatC [Streptococcaceae bacterium]
MSQITADTIKHVAGLSKLEIPEDKIQEFTDSFSHIIEMVEKLDEVDTAGVEFTMSVADNVNRMREDVSTQSKASREELMANVPEQENGFIKVPAMLADGGDA